jgi:hypothetical protein
MHAKTWSSIVWRSTNVGRGIGKTVLSVCFDKVLSFTLIRIIKTPKSLHFDH